MGIFKKKKLSKKLLREEIKKELCKNCPSSGISTCLVYEGRGKCPLVFLDEILEITLRILKKYGKI